MKTLKQQIEKLDLSIRKTDSVTDLLSKQFKLKKIIEDNVIEFREQSEDFILELGKASVLLDYCIMKLAEATRNGIDKVDNTNIDLMKNRVWSRIEQNFILDEEDDEKDNYRYFMNV